MTKQMELVEKLTKDAVKEVFEGMLSMKAEVEPPGALAQDAGGQIAGSVGFIGEANGVIYLYAGVSFARVITSRMLGISEAEVDSDDMVNDAVGELSNMVVGYVKSRLCDAGWPCTLTIPSIVRGQQLTVESLAQVTRRVVGFRSGTHQFFAEMLIKES